MPVLTPGATSLAQLEAMYWADEAASLTPECRPAVEAAAAHIAAAAAGSKAVYGVNTGFGKLASVAIAPKDTARLQRNLILSHCSGVGDPIPAANDPADDGVETAVTGPRRLWRPVGSDRTDDGHACGRCLANCACAGLGWRLRRSRAARPHGGRDDWRRRG